NFRSVDSMSIYNGIWSLHFNCLRQKGSGTKSKISIRQEDTTFRHAFPNLHCVCRSLIITYMPYRLHKICLPDFPLQEAPLLDEKTPGNLIQPMTSKSTG